jgi:phosphate starvation-inducible PhoH-like protein
VGAPAGGAYSAQEAAVELNIALENPRKQGVLFGPADRHLKMIREAFGVQLFARQGQVKVTGSAKNVSRAAAVLQQLQRAIRHEGVVTGDTVSDAIRAAAADAAAGDAGALDVYIAAQHVRAKTAGQRRYIEAMRKHDLVFCTGPAGTGKTYLAVAMAVHMLKHQQTKRLILVRPAVEAGEKLGFLPGDMQAKVNPYLRPLLDALHDMMEYDQIRRFMANDLIEIIPMAFMRGRTLNDSCIILDEAQNTTRAQMLMFLTRMGHGSKMIVTGDDSQIDLPEEVLSGLLDAKKRLAGIKGLSFVRLDRGDIVRHRLVQNIVEAYGRDGEAQDGLA